MSAGGVLLLVDSSHGVYTPRELFSRFPDIEWSGITQEDIKICSTPDNPDYWEAWDRIVHDAFFSDASGNTWRLFHEGDLFAVCFELMSDETYFNLFGVHRDVVH